LTFTFPIALLVWGACYIEENHKEWIKTHSAEIFSTLAITAFLAIEVILNLSVGYIVGIITVAALVAAVPLFFIFRKVVSFLSDWVAGRRLVQEEKDEARREAFNNGEITYDEYIGRHIPNKFEIAVAKFFRGLGDFVILIGQVIRVNKWKICPTVEVK
jgi:hypothetical protein